MNSKGLSTSVAAIFVIVLMVAILIPLGVSLFLIIVHCNPLPITLIKITPTTGISIINT
jgi:hypothetical protein